jgi:predicted RNase H-like nuclease (RuvC/YqgF family)
VELSLEMLLAILSSATVSTLLGYGLHRRMYRAQTEAATADALAHYQNVVSELWQRLEELERRAHELQRHIHELEREVENLRLLVQAYEGRFGRRFTIMSGRVVELEEGGAAS